MSIKIVTLFQLTKLIQPFSCFVNQTVYVDIRICIGFDFFLICITCGALRQRNFHWELRFLTQAREIYGKSITILFMYKINQTETDTADGSYSCKYNSKRPTPHSHGTANTCSVSGYGHFTPYENDDHFHPSIYSGCFTYLILFKLYINPTGYTLSLPFCIRKG